VTRPRTAGDGFVGGPTVEGPVGAVEPPADGASTVPPVWFERTAVAAATGVGVVGTVALASAVVGRFGPPAAAVALVVGAAAAVVAARAAVPSAVPPTGADPAAEGAADVARDATGGPSTGRSAHRAALVVVLVAVASAAWSAWAPSQHVLTDRDPAVYVSAAEWMGRHGTLRVEDPLGAFGGSERIGATSPGMYADGGGLEFQFAHLAPAFLAVVDTVVGDAGLFRATGVVLALGLLPIWAMAVRVTRRPWASVLAPLAVAVSMPAVASGRDVFSEPYVLLLVWTAMVLLARTWPAASVAPAVVAGFLVGASVAVRADAALVLVAPSLLLAAALALDGPGRLARWWRAAGAFVAGLVLPAAVGLVDLHRFSGGYVDLIGDEVRVSYAAIAAAALVPLAVTWARRSGRELRWPAAADHRWVAAGVGIASAGAVVALWLVRPAVQQVRATGDRWDAIGLLQAREGLEVDLARTYAEDALGWMAWYLGPATLLLAAIGVGWAAAVLVRRRAPVALVVLAVVAGVGGGYYLWKPSIYPDQVWAARRFLPLVLPALVVLAVWVVVRLADAAAQRVSAGAAAARTRAAVIGLGAVCTVVPPALATAPVALQRSQHGVPAVVAEACGLAGEDAAVLVIGSLSDKLLPQTVRTRCDLPVATTNPGTLTDDGLPELAAAVEASGRRLVLLTLDDDGFDPYPTAAAAARRTAAVTESRALEHTISRRPQRYQGPGDRFYQPLTVRISVAAVPADRAGPS
jgi:hypothetical protein